MKKDSAVQAFDCIIIGGGQGASLAAMLARAGRKVAVIEKSEFGGTCVNRGCTPTKALVASARVASTARRAAEWGVQTGGVHVDMAAVTRRQSGIVRDFRSDIEDSLEIENLTIVRGEARFTAPRTVQVLGEGEPRLLSAETVVVATGTQNKVPEVEGLGGVPFLTSTTVLKLEELPAHLLVMGGGYIAVEMAQALRRLGARVTIIEKNKRLLSKEDADVSQAVREILEGGGIEVVTGAEVKHAAQDGEQVALQVLVGEETRAFEGSHLLVATGRQPATKALNLEAAGIERDEKGFVQVDEFLGTSADGVFALGDVAKSPPFTHIAFDDARILAGRILRGEKRSTKERILTWTVFIDPQLGHVGLSEEEARKKGLQFDIARIEMDEVARPLETGESLGSWKVLIERGSGQILGGAFLSIEGGEMAALCLVAMVGKLPYTRLRDLPISHPTLAESFNNLFLKFDREQVAKKA